MEDVTNGVGATPSAVSLGSISNVVVDLAARALVAESEESVGDGEDANDDEKEWRNRELWSC